MINGRFVVFGSPNYLKSKYGHGYTVTIRQTKEAFNDPSRNILEVMPTLIPQALLVHTEVEKPVPALEDFNPALDQLSSQKTLETRFKIEGINEKMNEFGEVQSLSDVFRKLNQIVDRQIIKDFALTRTTMSEVFTDFAKFQVNVKGEE